MSTARSRGSRVNESAPFIVRLAQGCLMAGMDASEFKEYIFGMLFVKRCSDVLPRPPLGLLRPYR